MVTGAIMVWGCLGQMVAAKCWLTFYFDSTYIVLSGIGPVSVRFHLFQRDGFRFDAHDAGVDASSVYRNISLR